MEVDDIISYHDVVTAERAALQKGMNFGVGKKYSIFLMSLRENAPYADALDPVTGMLTYECHDEPQRRGGPNPKDVDQPLIRPRASWREKRNLLCLSCGFHRRVRLLSLYGELPVTGIFTNVIRKLCRIVRV
jgi:hypothetical protein